MVSNKPFSQLFSPKPAQAMKQTKEKPDKLSVKAGRQSLPADINTVGGLIAALGVSMPDFNFRFLEALENLSMYNAEVSNAVENIISLGNTAKTFPNISFEDDLSDELKKEMIQRLKTRSKKWYPYSAGLNSLSNDLLGQIAINGALSAEIVPNSNLDGLETIVLLPPKHVRFKYDSASKGYGVYQEITNSVGMTNAVDGNLIPLNTTTYKYITMRRISEKPYGIPPFLAALENIAISRDMSQNLMYVAKKLGILGFLEVLIKAPKPMQNEKEQEYFKRSEAYLSAAIPEIEKGLSKGYVAGFRDNHEFRMQPTANAEGAKELVEINDVKLFSGLKQDPLMFGRNFSTTESLARVVLSKMVTQINNYQSILSSFYEQAFLIDLQLAGYPVNWLEVTFDAPMVSDKFKDEQAREKEIANASALYQAGIISQQDRAVELGYEKPDQEEPRALPEITANGGDTDPTATEDKSKNDSASNHKATGIDVVAASTALGGHLPEYQYHTEGCTCPDHKTASYSSGDKDLDRFISSYLASTKKNYRKASNSIIRKLAKLMGLFTTGGTDQAIVDSVLHLIYREWNGSFTAPQTKIINSFVNSIYTYFRKDSAVFGTSEGIPKGAFSTVDFRALDYYKKSDTFYLGKFITDEDLKKKITAYIKEQYLENRLPIAGMDGTLEAFTKEFGDIFEGQDWKLRRVIDTTVAKMRNTAAVSYFQQADIEQYEIVGVADRLQCDYCKNMQGKTFSVNTAMTSFSQTVQSDPALVAVDSPFVTSVYKKAEEMKDLTGEQLQVAGIHFPPFHSLCRDTVVAIL